MPSKTSARSAVAKIIVAAIVIALAFIAFTILVELGIVPRQIAPAFIYSIIVLLVGIWLVSNLGGLALNSLKGRIGHAAYTIRNVVLVFGYAILVIIVLSLFGISPDVAIAGGTVSGLVIGLGAQPLLSNFFAGLLILTTGFFKVGDEVRLLASSIPYLPAQFPAYKFFSADYVNTGYRGTVIEVGLFYSMLRTDTGLELRVPNQVIFNSAVVDYKSARALNRSLQVRYEFSVTFDPDIVLPKIKNSLLDIEHIDNIVISEQSDKEYYIVLIEFSVSLDEDWTEMKSEILRRLVKVHRELKGI